MKTALMLILVVALVGCDEKPNPIVTTTVTYSAAMIPTLVRGESNGAAWLAYSDPTQDWETIELLLDGHIALLPAQPRLGVVTLTVMGVAAESVWAKVRAGDYAAFDWNGDYDPAESVRFVDWMLSQ